MNEEQLIEFINWLPTAVPEFQNASPEQIVQTLNQLYESEEGQATLSQLFTAFQESKEAPQSQMFKKGGKLDQLTQKAKKGKKMCCKKKEIVQGGMVNKVIEKAQDGNKLTRRQALDAGMTNQGYDRSQARIALANAMNTGRDLGMRGKELRQWARQVIAAIPEAPDIDAFSDIVIPDEAPVAPEGRFIFTKAQLNPTIEPMQNPQTFAQAFANARKNGLEEFTWRGNKYNTLTKEEAAALPMVDSRYSDTLYRDFWNKKFPSNYVEKQQAGGEFDNPLVRNATLSTLGILDSTRPFIQQNVTPNETREFYAYSRDRLPDNVGGTGNFEGAIRTITPRDTTISYQLPGLAIYTAASSKDRGPRWKEMNSKMDAIKNKANNQKNK